MQLLTQPQQDLLRAERETLHRLQEILAEAKAAESDRAALRDALLQLDDFFLVVVVGEFNAGKSALINALLGDRVLEEGVTPTTTQVNVIRYGETPDRRVVNAWLHEIDAPAPLLRELSVVDTPGVNAILREHEAITRRFLPRADLVLFVTSADRPFTESERLFLQAIRDWGKKVVLIINKIDILRQESDLAEIVGFVEQNAQNLLGLRPEIFPVSARLALSGKEGQAEAWEASRFAALERYIADNLDAAERLRLKFDAPLGVAANLIARYRQTLAAQQETLQADLETLRQIEGELALYRQDMEAGFERHMADVENSLYQMALRGQQYFSETLRLRRIFDLLDRKRIQQEFEEQVTANTPQEINDKVQALIDWLIANDLQQWQAVQSYLDERRRAHDLLLDGSTTAFQYDRQRLLDSLGQRAEQVLAGYDRQREANKLAESAQAAVAATAAAEIGAVGLGAAGPAGASTAAADLTGILLAGTVAVLGLFVIPARQRQAKKELTERLETLRTDLGQALRTTFDREISASLERITEAIAPYSRFVRAQHQRLSELQAALDEAAESVETLRARIAQELVRDA